MKTNNQKIDIYLLNRNHGKMNGGFVREKWSYFATTTWAKTCKQAKISFLNKHNYLSEDQVKCTFQKGAES